MSFLKGLIKSGVSAIASGNIWANLATTAVLAYAVNKTTKNAGRENGAGTDNIDKGVRLQVKPNAESKIPVLYGSAFFGGNISDAAMTNANRSMWYSIVLSEKTGTQFSNSAASTYVLNNVYWNNQRIVFRADGITADYTVDSNGTIDRSLSGLVKVYFYAGGRTNGQLPQGFTGDAPPNAETLFPNWTADTHAMSNLIFAIVRVDYNREKNITGLGDMLFNVTNSMNKPGDVVYDYLSNTVYGAGISTANIIGNDITALNTYSAEGVAYDDQGSGAETLANRYQINGLIDSANAVLENAEQILSAAASWLSYDTHTGQWGVVINKADTSVAAFNDSNILGSINLSGTGLQNLYNSVKVEFPHRELRDSADFYNIAVPTSSIPSDWTPFSRNLNEEDNVLNLTYDIINEPIQAQMLGLIELKQSRIDKIIQFSVDFSYYNLKAGDIVTVTNSRFGFTNKAFRIVAVTEQQEESALSMSITALEYNVNVYSVADLFRFTRSDADGIITIGNIGVPGTPTVTKFEIDARPRTEITSTAPTGVVSGMEFWFTTDVNTPDDSARSYTLIGTKLPAGGGVYTSGTSVTIEYVANPGNFLVKTRGFNATTVGSFSAPSGLVEFAPTQVTQAISPDTKTFDVTGGLVAGLAASYLLGKVGEIFKESDIGKSFMDAIYDQIQETTGIDFRDADEDELIAAAAISTKADGSELSAKTTSFDFIGPIKAEGSGDNTVKLIDGAADKDILAWNSTAGEWQLISGCVSCDFAPPPPEPPAPATPCSLTLGTRLPGNNHSLGNLCVNNSDVPYTGSYFVSFNINPGTNTGGGARPAIPFYAPLQRGVGNVYLYGTDGVLEQTLTESQIIIDTNVVELPFAPRMPGKDYYILIDDGLVTSCSCENVAVDTAGTWTFRTSLTERPSYTRPGVADITGTTGETPSYAGTLRVTSVSPVGQGVCINGATLRITYSENIKPGSGSVIIKNRATGETVSSYNISSGSTSENTAEWGAITGLAANLNYDIEIPAGLVITDRQASSTPVCDTAINTPAGPDVSSDAAQYGFTTAGALSVVSFFTCIEPSGATAISSNIQIVFNKTIQINSAGAAWLYIYSADGGLHQKIDLSGTFTSLKYGSIYGVTTSTLTVNPTRPFKSGLDYYVNIDAGAIIDPGCAVPFAGINDTETVRFSTEGVETTPPQGPSFGSLFIRFQFGRQVVEGQGKLNIIDSDTGELYTQVTSNDPAIKFSKQPFVQ
jgi:hypothetical protein